MNLKVLSSGSIGNCYILESDKGEILIIDAGVSFSEIQKAINFQYKNVIGCLVSHEHGDHAKSVDKLVKYGVQIYTSSECAESVGIEKTSYFNKLEHNHFYRLDGKFEVIPFNLTHDVPTFGFVIMHPECGQIVFATDTSTLNYIFPETNHFLVESNFCMYKIADLEMSGKANEYVVERVKRSHLSIQKCLKFLEKNDLSNTHSITLIHLSDSNSDQYKFRNDVIELTGKPTYIAEKGLEINLNLNW